jgi:ParB family chromosome partitioning protein
MKFRPECEIWPLMTDDQLKALAADIDERNQLYPISLYQGDILDGRNRYLAMTRFGRTKPRYENVNPKSPIAFTISHNEKRRQMNDGQRSYCAALAMPFFEAEAKKRQEATGPRGKEGGRGKKKPSSPNGEKGKRKSAGHLAADDAAKAFNTSSRTVQRSKLIHDKGSAKLKDAVHRGALSPAKAEQIIKAYPEKSKQDRQVVIIAESKMVTRAKSLTGEIEWYTPRKYLDLAIAVMGSIDLDPASSELAQNHVKAGRFFTIDDDGLKQPWHGNVFLNPPYAMPFVREFTAKMVESFASKSIAQGILLVNNATDTEWFSLASAACSAVCLTRGRISFLEVSDGEIVPKASPVNGQAFFYFGPDVERFAEVFSAIGNVWSLMRPHANGAGNGCTANAVRWCHTASS